MTTAKPARRPRRPRAGQELMPRGQHLIDQGADMLILSARLAAAPEPVFWAEGELDARAKLAVQPDADWDGHYERALPGDENPWEWYRTATAADQEPAAVAWLEITHDDPHPSAPLPAGDWAVTLPAGATVDEKIAEILARFNTAHDEEDGKFSDPGEEDAQWRLAPDDPGPDEGDTPPQSPGTAGTPRTAGAPGPGSPDQDEASDELA